MNLERVLTTVDTHTAGGPTRTVISGIPHLHGSSAAEQMDYFRNHFDSLRRLLMLEPRGHSDMSGAVLTRAQNPEAVTGAFFITARGYLRACVHSSIGVITAGLNTGFIARPEAGKSDAVCIETPSGLVTGRPRYRDGEVSSVALQIPPAFVSSARERIALASGKSIEAAFVYSGVFFVLVDVRELGLAEGFLAPQHAKELAGIGMDILASANRSFNVSHPENSAVKGFDLVMLYEPKNDLHATDIVVGPTGAIDRSPCGAGTGAMVAYLASQDRLRSGDDFVLENFLGTRFTGRIVGTQAVGNFPAFVPEVEGTAYMTGMHQFVLDSHDPYKQGLDL